MDSYAGDPHSPHSLHRYLYVGADPVNRLDPTGEQETLGELATAIDIYLSNVSFFLYRAFALGGSAVGLAWQALGADAQDAAENVLAAAETEAPGIIQNIETDVEVVESGGGTRVIDFAVRVGQSLKEFLLEVKYSLPTSADGLERVAGQIDGALQENPNVVLWTLRPYTFQELQLLAQALGENYYKIEVLTGVDQLYDYILQLAK